MKKLTLIEQLDRIQQMMGVPQKLIMEQPVNFIVEKGAKQLWKTLEELFSGTIERGTEKSLEKTLEELTTVVGKENVASLKLISKGVEDVATKNAKIVNFLANNPVIKKNIERMLEVDVTFTEALNKSTDKFIKDPEISKYLNDFYIAALERSSGNVEKSQEVLIEVLAEDFTEQELKRYFKLVNVEKLPNGGFNVKFKEEIPINNIADTPINPNNATENGAGRGPGVESEEVINNIEELAKKPGTTNQIIQSIIKSFNLQDLQSVISAWRRGWKNMDKLQAEFNVYADRMEKNINNNLRYDDEFKKMQDILLAVKKQWAYLPKETYELWLSELSQKAPKTAKVINGTTQTGLEWKFFYNELLKQEGFLKPIFNETTAFRKLWPLRMLGSKREGFLIFKKPSEDLGKRLGNLILFKDPRTFAEMKNSLMINGVKQDVIRTIFSKVATETIFGPIALSTIGIAARPIAAAAEALYNGLTDSDSNWIDYNEPDDSGERSSDWLKIIKDDWMQSVKSLMPEDVWEAMIDVIDPTFVDEFIMTVIKPLVIAGKTIDESELKDKVNEFKDRKSAEYKIWYDSQTKEAKKVIDEYTKKFKDEVVPVVEPIVDKLADDEAGFRAFCDMTKKPEFRTENKIDKEYTFKEWRYLAGLTNETNSLGSYTWYWDKNSKIFKPYN
jgi:hypothetical protein